MSDLLTVENDGAVSELSSDINVITAEINSYKQIAGQAILEIGRRLKHVKENDLVHGEWIKWLESIDMTRQQAHRFITVYEEIGKVNVPTSLHLGLNALYEIATMPEEEREKPHTIPSTGETKTVNEMTVRELREVKRALKEREQALKEAERRAKLAEEEAARARRQAESKQKVEVRTEYIEVVKPDERLKRRLEEYEKRFGAIENYSDRPRATNLAEVTTAVMSFSKDVRDLARRHAYLIQYQSTVSTLDKNILREYNEAVEALSELAKDFKRINEEGSKTIINAEYRVI